MPAQLWPLLAGDAPLEIPADGDDLDRGWCRLVDAVPAGENAHVKAALPEIVE
jgi:hypothetical protein